MCSFRNAYIDKFHFENDRNKPTVQPEINQNQRVEWVPVSNANDNDTKTKITNK